MSELKSGMWAAVELLGHRRAHGQLTEVTFGGAPLIQIQCPECGTEQLYGAGAIYAIHPLPETDVREKCKKAHEPWRGVQQIAEPGRADAFEVTDNDDDHPHDLDGDDGI